MTSRNSARSVGGSLRPLRRRQGRPARRPPGIRQRQFEPLEDRLMLARDLLIADPITDSILRFDGETGQPVGALVSSGAGGLDNPHAPTFGPDGNLYVFSQTAGAGKILRFDGSSGAFMNEFVVTGSGGFRGGSAMAFGPDGNLYVATATSQGVLRFDGASGAFDGAVGDGAGMRRALGLDFGPDGNLYVLDGDGFIDTFADRILRFDPATGALIDEFVAPGAIDDAFDITFGPDGHLYVAEVKFGDIRRFSGTTGEFLGSFAQTAFNSQPAAFSATFGADGNLYASNDDGILRFEGETGAFLDTFVDGVTGLTAFFPPGGPPADLAVTSVLTPPGVVQGADVSITYTVTNHAADPTPVDEWIDVVYLSADDIFDPGDTEVGRIEHTGGLAAGASYAETLTAQLPSVPFGDYHVLILTDRRGQAGDASRANNLALAAETIEVFPPLASTHDPDHSIAVGRRLSTYTTADVAGGEMTITYTVYNLTDGYAQGTLLTTTLAAGVTFVGASLLPDQNGQELAWSLGTLAPHGRANVEVNVSLASPGTTQLDTGPQAFAAIDTVAVSDDLGAAVLRMDVLDAALLAATPDADSEDPFIQEKAAELDYDSQRIFDFLRNDVGYNSYTGSLRGARGTLWSGAGNALDVASLGVALMRTSGIPARYVSGTLSQQQTQELILSMFSENFQTVGFISPGTELADPANDPQLLTETESHYWFQFDTGDGMRDADPLMAGAQVGQTFAVAGGTFAQVADNLRAKTTVTLVAEFFSQGGAMLGAGNGLSEKVVLQQTFDDVRLVGRPLTIANFVNSNRLGTPFFTTVTNTYSPYIQISDVANLNLAQDEILRGIDFQEVLTNFPLGTQALTGLFLEITTTDPQADGQTRSQTTQKTLFDRIGFAARQGGAPVNVSAAPDELPALDPFNHYSLWISSASAPESVLIARQVQLAVSTQELSSQLSATIAASPGSADPADFARLNSLTRQVLVQSLGVFGDAFLTASAMLSTSTQAYTLTTVYFDSPRILAVTNTATTDGDMRRLATEMDILQNGARVLSAPGQAAQNQDIVHLTRGILDKSLEAQIIAGTGAPVETSSIEVFFAALEADYPLVSISAANLRALDALPLSDEAKARITRSVLDGNQVLTPTAMLPLANGATTIAWLQRNPTSGEWTFVSENGGHAASSVEYAGVEIEIPDEVVSGQATVVRATEAARAEALKIIPKIKEAKKLRAKQIQSGNWDYLSYGIGWATKELDKVLPKDPTNIPLTVFRLVMLSAVTDAALDPPLPNYFRRPGGISSAESATTQTTPSTLLSVGAVAGDVEGTSVRASGFLSATWTDLSASQFSALSLHALQSEVTDAHGNSLGSGSVELASDRVVPVSISGNQSYVVSGHGSLSFYGQLASHLGVSADWDNYSAAITGNVAVGLTVPPGALTLNGQTLPAGKYTLTTNSATLSGSGNTSSPNFAGSVSLSVSNAVVNLGPASGNITVDGQVLSAHNGITLAGYSGSLAVTAGDANLDSVTLDGNANGALAVSVAPALHTTDQNGSVAFQVAVNTSFADAYHLAVQSPPGWAVTTDGNGGITATPAPGLQGGTHPIQIVAQAMTNPNLTAQATVNVAVTPAAPDATLTVQHDPIFTVPFGIVPFGGSQVPSAFQAHIQNLGPDADTYHLTFPTLPAGFRILNSLDRVTVPAGETGIIGIYLEPIGQLPPPGAQVSFEVRAASANEPTIIRTVTVPFTVPEIHGVSVVADPGVIDLQPGLERNADVTFTAMGNVAEDVMISVVASPGLTVTGPIRLELGEGEAITIPFSYEVAPDIPFNSILPVGIIATFADGELGSQADRILVRVAAPGVDAVTDAASAADVLGSPDLANGFNELGVALTNLAQHPNDPVFKSQALASLDSILTLLAVDPLFVDFVEPLAARREQVAAASTSAGIHAALQSLAAALDDFAAVTGALSRGNFEVFLAPNSQVAQPLVPREFVVKLHNIGTETTTYDLDISGLPGDVTAQFGETSVTLARDGFADVTLTLTQTTTAELLAFSFTVDVSIAGVTPAVAKSAAGSLRTRNEFVSVTSVDVDPPFVNAGEQVNLSARLLNTVNRRQNASVSFTVFDPGGAAVFTSTPVPVQLTVQTSLVSVDLGGIDTTGFALGPHTIEVLVRDESGSPIPGATGQQTLLIGSPVTARQSVTPQLLPPGTSTVTNTLEIEAAANLGGGGEPFTLVGHLPVDAFNNDALFGVEVNDGIVYVFGNAGLHVVDTSNPTAPSRLTTKGGFEHRTGVLDTANDRLIAVDDGTISIVGFLSNSSVTVYDLSGGLGTPENPGRVQTVFPNYTSGGTPVLSSDASHVFVTTFQLLFNQAVKDFFAQNGTLLSFDLGNLAALPVDALLNDNGRNSQAPFNQNGGNFNFLGVARADANTLYIGSSTSTGDDVTTDAFGNPSRGRILLVDVSDPADLNFVGDQDPATTGLIIPHTAQVHGIAIDGDLALAVGSEGNWLDPFVDVSDIGPLGNLVLATIDVSDRRNPQVLHTQTLDRAARGGGDNVVSLGNGLFAFASLGSTGDTPQLFIVDASDPAGIQIVEQLDVPGGIFGLDTDGTYLYASGQDGLTIYSLGGAGAVPVSAEVQVPKGTGVEIVPGSFNIDPAAVLPGPDFDTLVWNVLLDAGMSSQTITWNTSIADLQPGESRAATLGTAINFTVQGSDGRINLPLQNVFAEQVLALDPASRTLRPGETAAYTVTIANPAALEVTYDLGVQGVPAEWVDFAAHVIVPAGGSVDLDLTLTSDPFAALAEYGFVVTAAVNGASGSVEGVLTLIGDPVLPAADPQARGVVLSLDLLQATAGQGTGAVYTARVTNTGSVTDTFDLAVSDLPPGFTASFAQGAVVVPPGASNFREVTLVIVPPSGTLAGNHSFLVTAGSSQFGASDAAEGLLTVLAIGVDVELTPSSGAPGTTFDLIVTNTGQVTDTFDLALAAPAALVSALGTASVTLAPGQSQAVPIDVGEIDFAFPGSLLLVGAATSRTDPAVQDSDAAEVTIDGVKGMTAAFERPAVERLSPGPASFLLLVGNLGNLEDQYTATIVGTTGPVTASLNGLDGTPTQTVPLFILPGLSGGAILLDAALTDFGVGTVLVRVTSLTDGSIVAEATASVTALSEVATAGISGFVYLDTDNDGVKDPGEVGLPNVPVTLSGPVTLTQVTGPDGSYAFADLPPGIYTLTQTQPGAFRDGLDTPGTPLLGRVENNRFVEVDLAAGTEAVGYNFGELGLIPELISKRLFLSSTPPMEELMLQFTQLSTEDAWLGFQAGEDGILYGELDGAAGEVPVIELYDSRWMPLAISAGQGAVTASVHEGESYLIHVAGDGPGATMRMTNLVTHLGEKLIVHGTAGDDVFEFSPGSGSDPWVLRVNGLEYPIAAGHTLVELDGLAGEDRAHFIGSGAADTAVIRPGAATVRGGDYTVRAVSVESIQFDGANGQDVARLYGSHRANLLALGSGGSDPTQATLTGGGVRISATAEVLYAYGRRGKDVAWLPDSGAVSDEHSRSFSGFREVAAQELSMVLDLAAKAGAGGPALPWTEDDLAAFAQILWLDQLPGRERSADEDDAASGAVDQILATWPES